MLGRYPRTLHRWLIVGKTRLAEPHANRWWQVPLYDRPGRSAGPCPAAAGSCGCLTGRTAGVHTCSSRTHQLALQPRSVADFYHTYQTCCAKRHRGEAMAGSWKTGRPSPRTGRAPTPRPWKRHRAGPAQRRAGVTLAGFADFIECSRSVCSGQFSVGVTLSGQPRHPAGCPITDWAARVGLREAVLRPAGGPSGDGQEGSVPWRYAYPASRRWPKRPFSPRPLYSRERRFFLP
jgi:hypothetical protein